MVILNNHGESFILYHDQQLILDDETMIQFTVTIEFPTWKMRDVRVEHPSFSESATGNLSSGYPSPEK